MIEVKSKPAKNLLHTSVVEIAIALGIFVVFVIMLSQVYLAKADNGQINVLAAQINAVQRAALAYQRVNPQAAINSTDAPTLDRLVMLGYLANNNDVNFVDGVYHLYTLWQGEITVGSQQQQLIIQVAKLPSSVCSQVLRQLSRTSPQASCQGENNDPQDWLLRIPIGTTRLLAG